MQLQKKKFLLAQVSKIQNMIIGFANFKSILREKNKNSENYLMKQRNLPLF